VAQGVSLLTFSPEDGYEIRGALRPEVDWTKSEDELKRDVERERALVVREMAAEYGAEWSFE
jgi:hypothetical protein